MKLLFTISRPGAGGCATPPPTTPTPVPADDLAGTSHLRRRRPRLIIRPDEATDYWERNLLYEDDGAEVGCGAGG